MLNFNFYIHVHTHRSSYFGTILLFGIGLLCLVSCENSNTLQTEDEITSDLVDFDESEANYIEDEFFTDYNSKVHVFLDVNETHLLHSEVADTDNEIDYVFIESEDGDQNEIRVYSWTNRTDRIAWAEENGVNLRPV